LSDRISRCESDESGPSHGGAGVVTATGRSGTGGRRWGGTTEYLRSHTEELDLPGEIEEWREELVRYGLNQLIGDSSDSND